MLDTRDILQYASDLRGGREGTAKLREDNGMSSSYGPWSSATASPQGVVSGGQTIPQYPACLFRSTINT